MTTETTEATGTLGLSSLVSQLYDIWRQKSALEKVEKVLLEQIKPLADPTFDATPKTPITIEGLTMTRIEGTSRTISADLLLERGVAPDIIAYATKTSTYFQYRIKEVK